MSLQYFKVDLSDPNAQAVLNDLATQFSKVYAKNVFSVNKSDDGLTAWAKGVTYDPKAACVKDTATPQTHDKVITDCYNKTWQDKNAK